MKTFNQQVVSNILLNANYDSPYVPLRQIYTYCMAAIITGTPTGTLTLQASNDPETNDTQTNQTSGVNPAVGPSNWVTIANSSFAVSSAGETMWNVNFVGYNYVRVHYVDGSSGASTARMKIIFNGKG